MSTGHQAGVPFWSFSGEDLLSELGSSRDGLSAGDAKKRLSVRGGNVLKPTRNHSGAAIFLRQFASPITIILLLAAILSFCLGDRTDTVIIFLIVLTSAGLGYWQEKTAGNAVEQLLGLIRTRASAVRGGQAEDVPAEELVPGDIVRLSAGDIVPADCLLLEADGLFIDEAAFTGETFPVEKTVGALPAGTSSARATNAAFMGSHVVSGTATALVVNTGEATEFGHITRALGKKAPETAFTTGIRRFGFMLMQLTVVLVSVLFTVNVLLHKPVLDSLLFTLAIAVGLTPQLLPAIVTVNFSQGAKRMAARKVIVKHLSAIENFGNMTVLCSDKTGTLTEGKVRVGQGLTCCGKESADVLLLARLNASFQQGFKNPVDEALLLVPAEGADAYTRLDEIPYDFIRKRLSVLVADKAGQTRLITKGAVKNVLEICTGAVSSEGVVVPLAQVSSAIQDLYEKLSARGVRTLGIACKECGTMREASKRDERDMIFYGVITLFDPLKEGIRETIQALRALGVELKIITGDNALIAKYVSEQAGFHDAVILTGPEIKKMSDRAFFHQALRTNVFAEIEPNRKEYIITTLKKAGKTVSYMGDGINDVPAIHAADVGLSVNTAVDAAKEAADLVLLDRDLTVLVEGVKEGRRTFANTQKYIFMATSANFGNMLSMAGASFFLPFLPLLPKQILLTNLMTDFPSMALSADSVDEEWLQTPHAWDIRALKRFMFVFGVLSSVFDYMTFGVLLFFFHAGESRFHTGWFMESVVSATLIVLVIRTRKPFLESRPGRSLTWASLLIAAFALLLPCLPFAPLLGLTPVPVEFYAAMLGIVALYLLCAEATKRWFFKSRRSERKNIFSTLALP